MTKTKFQAGDRVRLTEVYAAADTDGTLKARVGYEGTVVGEGYSRDYIRVLMDKPVLFNAGELYFPEELELV